MAETKPGELIQVIQMTYKKDCKGSVVYEAPASTDEPVIRSVYLQRSFANPMPRSIIVTVKAGG